MWIDILKYAFLFLAIWFTPINISKVCLRNRIIFANFFYQAVGITGFVIIQWLI